jgi:hypothetical protein
MKLKLKGRRFDSIEEIQIESHDVMKTLIRNDFQQCFRSWKSRWNRCINANKNFGKWLSCGIQISGSFGLHHVHDTS